ncbi:MAG: hypothetical protein R6V85_20410 [Polyangia bacterium]
MNRRAIVALAGVVLVSSAAGCWPWENFADDEYKEALPRQQDLVVKIGEQDVVEGVDQQAALDPYAADHCQQECCIIEEGGEQWYVSGEIYEATREAKWHVNGALVVTLGWISEILEYPYSEETELGYIWGPWQESLSRIEFRFAMDKTSAGEFAFRLEGRNINAEADEAWLPVLEGDVTSDDQPYHGTGVMSVDYGAIHEIDVSHPTPAAGLITYEFDVRDYPYTVDVQFDGFEPEPGEVLDAVYHYSRLGSGMSGEFGFVAEADVWPEESPDGLPEQLDVESRWTAQGAGIGSASINGGSLDADAVESFTIEECWAGADCLYYQTWEHTAIDFAGPTTDISETGCGDMAYCPTI